MTSLYGILALIAAAFLAYFNPKGKKSDDLADILDDVFNQQKPAKPVPSKVIQDWECIPFVKFGPFKKDFSENDILKIVGTEHLSRLELPLNEENIQYSSILFGGTNDELIIDWYATAPYMKIESIRAQHDGTHWKTAEGITVGTPLEVLEKINQKSFPFYGLEWEHSGLVSEWNGGVVKNGIAVNLIALNPAAAIPVLVGETVFSSNQSEAIQSDMEVVSMEVKMN